MIGLLLLLVGAPQDDDKGFLGLHEAPFRIASESGDFDMRFSGILDLEHCQFGSEAPGQLFSVDRSFRNPRATMFVDTHIGEHLYVFLQTRIDRGFDPNYMDAGQIRLDEIFARYTVGGEDWSFSVQAGKFATPMGNFVPRHTSMKNAFVRPPLPHDHLTTVTDHEASGGNAEFVTGTVRIRSGTSWPSRRTVRPCSSGKRVGATGLSVAPRSKDCSVGCSTGGSRRSAGSPSLFTTSSLFPGSRAGHSSRTFPTSVVWRRPTCCPFFDPGPRYTLAGVFAGASPGW